MTASLREYFRRDSDRGVTAPDLTKICAFAEHIVRARGKRTKFTSVSLDPATIGDFGPALYAALKAPITRDQHEFIEHPDLIEALREAAKGSEKADRLRAVQAIRYATRRKEGLIDWRFAIQNVQRKDIITFAFNAVQKYFRKL